MPELIVLPTAYLDIPNFSPYRAGSDGTVWSQKSGTWKKLRPAPCSGNGRLTVVLRSNGKSYTRYVHHLILQAFVGPCPHGMEACHNDGRFLNNHASNLRWDTHAANLADRLLHGTSNRGSRHGLAKLNESNVLEIKAMLADGSAPAAVANLFGVSQAAISCIKNGANWGWLTSEPQKAEA